MLIVSLKQLSHYSCAVTNVLSFIIELAQFVVAVIQQDRRRRRGRGNGKLWPMECWGIQKATYLFSVCAEHGQHLPQ